MTSKEKYGEVLIKNKATSEELSSDEEKLYSKAFDSAMVTGLEF